MSVIPAPATRELEHTGLPALPVATAPVASPSSVASEQSESQVPQPRATLLSGGASNVPPDSTSGSEARSVVNTAIDWFCKVALKVVVIFNSIVRMFHNEKKESLAEE
ncbi:MAG TPA: hypothetical protein VN457_04130, partial [Chlamydiales bacterium]|nr:hypothetical protein [Chlamydiales bacterium]